MPTQKTSSQAARIDKLRQQIAAGTYRIDTEALAQRLLKELFDNERAA